MILGLGGGAAESDAWPLLPSPPNDPFNEGFHDAAWLPFRSIRHSDM
jgi:hypothetical protein